MLRTAFVSAHAYQRRGRRLEERLRDLAQRDLVAEDTKGKRPFQEEANLTPCYGPGKTVRRNCEAC